jgi:hypothetical protein
MKITYSFLFLLASCCCFAQLSFEKGYFIDNHGRRTDCLIKDIDWKGTPTEFLYTLSENDAPVVKKDFEIKEFAVGDARYISAEVDIDQSSTRSSKLSEKREPEFIRQRTLLKVLVDGSAKLYYLSNNQFERYFFSVGDSPIQPLVYKKYYIDFRNTDVVVHSTYDVAINNTYKQQLLTNVKSPKTTVKDVETLQYNARGLTNYFEKVNLENGDKTETKKAVKKGSFNVKASVMFGSHGMSVTSTMVNKDFGSKQYLTFGAEAEFILPFNKNKWSVIAEPTYNSFKAKGTTEIDEVTMNYKYLQLTVGFRHYLFLNANAKIFLNAGVTYQSISSSSNMDFLTHSYNSYEFGDNSIVFALGAGFNYGRFSIEGRYFTNGNPSPYPSVGYRYTNAALIGRYRFL